MVQEDEEEIVDVNEITDVMGQNLKKSVGHAVTAFEETSEHLQRFKIYITRLFRTLTSNIREFFDDFGLGMTDDDEEDEDGYLTFDKLKFDDSDEFADIRKKVMEAKSERLSNDYVSKLRDKTIPMRGPGIG